MKKYIVLGLALLFLSVSAKAYANDGPRFSCEHPHKNTVACYTSGSHAIVGESVLHYGFDIVWRNDDSENSKNFTQVFKGQGEYGNEWETSRWDYNGASTVCHDSGILVQNPKETGWGDYFPANSNYCVHNEEHVIHS